VVAVFVVVVERTTCVGSFSKIPVEFLVGFELIVPGLTTEEKKIVADFVGTVASEAEIAAGMALAVVRQIVDGMQAVVEKWAVVENDLVVEQTAVVEQNCFAVIEVVQEIVAEAELFHRSVDLEFAGTVAASGQQLVEVQQTAAVVFWETKLELALLVVEEEEAVW